jgi:hypothetical protein
MLFMSSSAGVGRIAITTRFPIFTFTGPGPGTVPGYVLRY